MSPASAADDIGPDVARLDLLGRMPVPLRRSFKLGLDRTLAIQRAAGGPALDCCLLGGAEWYHPFDRLAEAPSPPAMLVSTLAPDLLQPALWSRYTPRVADLAAADCHPACRTLIDPSGTFRSFAVVPFVLLVDQRRLAGRPAPRTWDDLLAPHWRGDIVFGGWRPDQGTPYLEFNTYLLFSLRQAYGDAGLRAFARNVRHLQHNVRSAALAGSNSPQASAVSVLPWLQAQLCPRRERTRIVWPEDGALAMPIGYLLRPGSEARLAPLVAYLRGQALAGMLAHNAYPPIRPLAIDAFPVGARLRWAGWEHLLSIDYARACADVAALFFAEQAQVVPSCDAEVAVCS